MKNKYRIDEKRLHDPSLWFFKARAYASVYSFIRKSFPKVVYAEGDPGSEIDAIRATPYIAGLAIELFMKGYLVFKGVDIEEIKNFRHRLKDLREACAKIGCKRFNDKNLKFITDTCGDHLMEEGGIRYPDKQDMLAYPQVKDALNILEEISGEIDKGQAGREIG